MSQYDHVLYFIVRTVQVQDSIVIEILRGDEKLGHAAWSYWHQFADRDGYMVAKCPASLAAINGGYRDFKVRQHDKPGYKIYGLRLFKKDVETLKGWYESTGLPSDFTWA